LARLTWGELGGGVGGTTFCAGQLVITDGPEPWKKMSLGRGGAIARFRKILRGTVCGWPKRPGVALLGGGLDRKKGCKRVRVGKFPSEGERGGRWGNQSANLWGGEAPLSLKGGDSFFWKPKRFRLKKTPEGQSKVKSKRNDVGSRCGGGKNAKSMAR